MGATLLLKTLRDARRSLVWWCVGVGILAAMWMGLFPSVRNSAAQMNQYLDKMPAALRSIFIGQGAVNLGTATGYLKMEVFSFMLPLLLLIYVVGASARTIAGEEEAGRLEVLLSQPITRNRIVWQKFAGIVATATILAAAFDCVLLIVAVAVSARLNTANLIEATFCVLLVALALGALALAIGCARGRKTLALAGTGGIAVLMYLVNALSPVVPALSAYRRVSLFYYYTANDPLVNGIRAPHVLVLIAFAAASLGAALIAFRRRDVAL